ncbi:MAG: transposase [Paludibacteraceae bacterium]|nr:transposase [Paludibacteraceae bacterium]
MALQKIAAIPLAIFIKKVLLGKCTGISFVDSTPLRVCRNQRIHIHKVFKGNYCLERERLSKLLMTN